MVGQGPPGPGGRSGPGTDRPAGVSLGSRLLSAPQSPCHEVPEPGPPRPLHSDGVLLDPVFPTGARPRSVDKKVVSSTLHDSRPVRRGSTGPSLVAKVSSE